MSTDITNAESSFSQGKTRYTVWQAQFEERWNRPILVGAIATLLASIPDDVKDHLPQAAIKALEDKIQLGDSHATKIQPQPDQLPPQLPGEPLRAAAQKYNGQIPGE